MELGPRLWRIGIATGYRISSDISLHWDCLQWWQALFCHWWRYRPTPWHCPRQKLLLDQCNNQHNVLYIVSILWPCHPTSPDRTWTHHWTWHSHMFRFHCRCCRHQCTQAWWWRAVIAGFLVALWAFELGDWLCAVCSWPSDQRSVCHNVLQSLPANL